MLARDSVETASSQIEVSVPKPILSFILPIYNHGREAAPKIRAWARSNELILPAFEVVIVDDGSVDDTYRALKELDLPNLRILRTDKNSGKGAALSYGVKHSEAEIVIFADGDLQILPRNFADFLNALRHAQIAIASKRTQGSSVRAGTKRKMLSVGFNCIVKLLLSLSINDTQAGFKVFEKSALERIIPYLSVKKYAFDVELLVVADLLEMKIEELPAFVELESSFQVRNIIRMFVDLLGITYRLRVKRWYQYNLHRSPKPYKPILEW